VAIRGARFKFKRDPSADSKFVCHCNSKFLDSSNFKTHVEGDSKTRKECKAITALVDVIRIHHLSHNSETRSYGPAPESENEESTDVSDGIGSNDDVLSSSQVQESCLNETNQTELMETQNNASDPGAASTRQTRSKTRKP
jgi:hypothetical protein